MMIGIGRKAYLVNTPYLFVQITLMCVTNVTVQC